VDLQCALCLSLSEVCGLGCLAVGSGATLAVCLEAMIVAIAELSRLQAPMGVWGCNGNHVICAGVEAKAGELFELYGMQLLRQQSARVLWKGQALNLIGVDYEAAHNSGRSGKRDSLPYYLCETS
jgi:hypothetical protein